MPVWGDGIQEMQAPLPADGHPLLWWRDLGCYRYPPLSKLAHNSDSFKCTACCNTFGRPWFLSDRFDSRQIKACSVRNIRNQGITVSKFRTTSDGINLSTVYKSTVLKYNFQVLYMYFYYVLLYISSPLRLCSTFGHLRELFCRFRLFAVYRQLMWRVTSQIVLWAGHCAIGCCIRASVLHFVKFTHLLFTLLPMKFNTLLQGAAYKQCRLLVVVQLFIWYKNTIQLAFSWD